tara:strand:+ start:159 stop:911 length:753 start_codon:yes stop_codon:yes gene_type:complete
MNTDSSSESFSEKKNTINKIVQELYDENVRLTESHQQYKCENDLELRTNITTIRDQENIIKERDNKIKELETDLSSKRKQLHEYEGIIRDLEDKMNELIHEKEEENRFNILKVQADTILEKEKEIVRLNEIINKENNKKILNVLDIMEEEIKEQPEICIIKKDNPKQKTLVEKMEENLKKEESLDKINESEDESDDDYEVITYRKKEYWLEKGEEPQNIYEIVGDDELGKKVGTYVKGKNGKMKVVLDKK